MKATNKAKRLAARLADWSRTIETRSLENKVQLRKETGGYHKPGSNKK